MKKSDLKSGMVVVTREPFDGRATKVCFVDAGILANGKSWMPLSSLDKNLLCKGSSGCDIMEVYQPKFEYQYGTTDLHKCTLVWRREPEIEITVKVNGEIVPLSTISDETIKAIKAKE